MTNWYKSFISTMIEDIAQADGISMNDFYGCTEAELQHMMNDQNVNRLPELYRQFMLQMGRGYASRYDDMVWTYPELLDHRGLANLAGENAYVMMWHNVGASCLYCFFVDNNLGDPPIFHWDEGFEELILEPWNLNLSEFLVGFFAPEEPLSKPDSP